MKVGKELKKGALQEELLKLVNVLNFWKNVLSSSYVLS